MKTSLVQFAVRLCIGTRKPGYGLPIPPLKSTQNSLKILQESTKFCNFGIRMFHEGRSFG